jgi:hypothetical protein
MNEPSAKAEGCPSHVGMFNVIALGTLLESQHHVLYCERLSPGKPS